MAELCQLKYDIQKRQAATAALDFTKRSLTPLKYRTLSIMGSELD